MTNSNNSNKPPAYKLGVQDRRIGVVRKLDLFSTYDIKEYSRGWIDEWMNEKKVIETNYSYTTEGQQTHDKKETQRQET